MNAPVQLPDAPYILPHEPFDRARRQCDEWRGRCQNGLALGEAAMTRCLQALSQVPIRGKKVTLPVMVGARYDVATALLGVSGVFEAEAAKTVATLTRWRTFDRLRVALCHGTADISLDQQGRWTLVLNVLAIRSGAVCPDSMVVRESTAESTYDDLMTTGQRLSAQLAGVENRVRHGQAMT